jgi:LPXTG-site transpeptidase (sortase) family protein
MRRRSAKSRSLYSGGCSSQWIAGLLIVIVVVIVFKVFESIQHPVPQLAAVPLTATPMQTDVQTVTAPTSTTLPTLSTSSPTIPLQSSVGTMRIVSEKARLSTQITPLYFGRNDDWDLSTLGSFAGHLEGTPKMGQGGNFVLAGHVELKDGVPGPFANLALLSVGDPITILSSPRETIVATVYRVTSVETVKPEAFDHIRNHGYEELTLVTCGDWDPVTGTYRVRLIIHARPVR